VVPDESACDQADAVDLDAIRLEEDSFVESPAVVVASDKQAFAVSPIASVFSFSSSCAVATPTLESIAAAARALSEAEDRASAVTQCVICGEKLLSAVTATDILNGTASDLSERAVQCPAGHKFCLSCWRTQLQMKVREDTVKALQCPEYKCGERLCAIEWSEANNFFIAQPAAY